MQRRGRCAEPTDPASEETGLPLGPLCSVFPSARVGEQRQLPALDEMVRCRTDARAHVIHERDGARCVRSGTVGRSTSPLSG